MSYLICEKCGKQYPLPEGEKSFYYEKCSCGGRLKYSPKSGLDFDDYGEDVSNSKADIYSNLKINPVLQKDSTSLSKEYKKDVKNKPITGIKWKGIFIGLLFLFISLIISVVIFFGKNIPTDPSQIPLQYLTMFSMLSIVLTVAAGSISAYLCGSRRFLVGALNGGMVGLILGLILGLAGGLVVFLSGTLVFGSLSMAGGIIGIIPRKLSKK